MMSMLLSYCLPCWSPRDLPFATMAERVAQLKCRCWQSHKKPHFCSHSVQIMGLMHWLHVNPNSDFSPFRHFFGWFLSSFSPKFVSKFRRKTKTKFQKSAKYFFLSKYLPKLCQKNAESLPSANYLPKKWQIPKFPVFFWQKICQITAENWPKFFQKSAEKVPKSREIGIRIYV